jgi:hypothetical protein
VTEAVLELVRRKVEATRDGRITSPTFLAELFALAELGADDRERGWDG